jgi:hypothetical protein
MPIISFISSLPFQKAEHGQTRHIANLQASHAVCQGFRFRGFHANGIVRPKGIIRLTKFPKFMKINIGKALPISANHPADARFF